MQRREEKGSVFTKGLFAYELVSLICLALLVIGVVYVFCRLVFPKGNSKNERRRNRIEYLKSFRKGQCAMVFIPMMILYLIGGLYGKLPVYEAILKALTKTFSAVVMVFETSFIESLLEDSRIYRSTVMFAFYMVAVSACIFGISLFVQKLSFTWTSWRRRRLFSRRLSKDTCIIFGNNPHSRMIYQSDQDYGYKRRYIVDGFDIPGDAGLFAEGIKYSSFKGVEREAAFLGRYLERLDNRKQARLSIIINFENDNQNIALAERFSKSIDDQVGKTYKWLSNKKRLFSLHEKQEKEGSKLSPYAIEDLSDKIKKLEEENKYIESKVGEKAFKHIKKRSDWEVEVDRISKLSIFVFGSETLDSIYLDIERSSCGYLYFVNKYKIIGQRFLWEHPFTDFMSEKHVDFTKALLKENTSITVSMVGFGKTNRRLLLDLISGNQFAIEAENNKEGRKPLLANYYIYDNRGDLHTKDLNHGYFRYEKFCAEHIDDSNYLPFADRPADEHFMSGCDINSEEFYDSLRHSFGRKDTDLNFIFISFGDDYENIELGKKLYAKKKEWGIANLVIFVKTKHPKTKKMLGLDDAAEQRLIPYGEEGEIYSLQKIISLDLYRIAAAADCAYWETSNRQNECARIWDWHSPEKNHIERQSSFYAGLNLKNKYGLFGLKILNGVVVDCSKPDIKVKLALKENERILVLEKIRGEKDVEEIPFAVVRDNLAYQEHLRWNAFMICCGYVPSSISQILEPGKRGEEPKDKGKNHEERRHGNLTTFEGLKEFSMRLSRKYPKAGKESDFDVIKYDYDLLDKSISGEIDFSETK